jgi:hypothetical protein
MSLIPAVEASTFQHFRLFCGRGAKSARGGIVLAVASDLGLDDLGVNLFKFEILDLSVSQQAVRCVGVGFGEGNEDGGGKLEIVKLERLERTAGAETDEVV